MHRRGIPLKQLMDCLRTNRRTPVCGRSEVELATDLDRRRMFVLASLAECHPVSQFFAVAQRVMQSLDICHNLSATISPQTRTDFRRPTTKVRDKAAVFKLNDVPIVRAIRHPCDVIQFTHAPISAG
jgi:hypothetical protein